MPQPASKRSLLATGTGSGKIIAVAAGDFSDNTKTPLQHQADFLAARFGIAADRARLTAELCWGGRT